MRGNASKLILQGLQYPGTKARQRCKKQTDKQTKNPANIPNERRCKNTPQNISQLYSAVH